MAKTQAINLGEPVVTHTGPIKELVFREPRARDFFELGEPFAYARNPDGTVYSAENADVINKYIERLLEKPNDPLVLAQVSLVDAMRIKETVLGFFTAARLQLSGITLTSSSSI